LELAELAELAVAAVRDRQLYRRHQDVRQNPALAA
jgi:hypothetical protein